MFCFERYVKSLVWILKHNIEDIFLLLYRIHIIPGFDWISEESGDIKIDDVKMDTIKMKYHSSYCPYLKNHSSYMKCHERTHTERKPFKCVICSKTFAEKSNLKKHSVILCRVWCFKCDICSKRFSCKRGLLYCEMLMTLYHLSNQML